MKESMSLFDSSCLSRDVLTAYHLEVESKNSAFILEISCQTLKSPKVRLAGWGAVAVLNGRGAAIFFPSCQQCGH